MKFVKSFGNKISSVDIIVIIIIIMLFLLLFGDISITSCFRFQRFNLLDLISFREIKIIITVHICLELKKKFHVMYVFFTYLISKM